jgi:hypothetical protein
MLLLREAITIHLKSKMVFCNILDKEEEDWAAQPV